MAFNLSHKIIKGVPVLVDKDNNVYMFSQQTPKEGLVGIGTTDGATITLFNDWRTRAAEFLEHYRSSLFSFQRIEHAKAVKYIKKPSSSGAVTAGAAATAATSTPAANERKAKVQADKRPNTRQPRNKSKSSQSPDNNT